MEIIQAISDSKFGLKREVHLIRLVSEVSCYKLQMEVKYWSMVDEEKQYLPQSVPAKEFVTTNTRRMLPSVDGAISLFSESEEGWEQAVPETIFYDYLLASGGVTLPVLLAGAILNLDSAKWNWFAE